MLGAEGRGQAAAHSHRTRRSQGGRVHPPRTRASCEDPAHTGTGEALSTLRPRKSATDTHPHSLGRKMSCWERSAQRAPRQGRPGGAGTHTAPCPGSALLKRDSWAPRPHLDEQPGGDQRQAAVLPVEAVVVGVEGKVVQIEEPGEAQEEAGAGSEPGRLPALTPGPCRVGTQLTAASGACWCWCGSRWRRTGQPATRSG